MSGSDPPPGKVPTLRVRDLARAYQDFRLGPVTFDLAQGQTLVVLGPNGSGKSTMLRLLAGLELPDSGSVALGGRDLTRLPAHRRSVGMVFQDLALFPQRTVWENVTYGLAVRRTPSSALERRGEELLREFRLGALSDRYPHQLSGGERQRVALARAIAPEPSLLLFDEPLSAADPRIARDLQSDLREFLRRSTIPAIYVTHDLDEGFFLADRLALLEGGSWVQEGPAQEVYEHPRTPFAAQFLGYQLLPSPGEPGRLVAARPESLELTEARAPSSLAGVLVGTSGGPHPKAFVRLKAPTAPNPREGSQVVEVPLPEPPAGSSGLAWSPGEELGLRLRAWVDLPNGGQVPGSRRVQEGEPVR